MAEPQYDAFGNILSLDSDLDKPSTYNIYENRAFSSGQGANLQNVYGTRAMPMFQFIRQIKTGERTYDPSRPEDRDFREQYERYQQQNPQAPTFAQVIGETAMGLAPRVGSAVGQALINPGDYLQGDALSRAGQGALDTFSPSPSQLVNEAYQNIAVSLNEEVIPAQTTTNNNYMQQQEHSTKVRELTRQELAQYKLLVGAKKVGAAIEVAANANIAGSFAAINEATDGNAKLTKNLTIAQAIADAYAGGARAFRDHVAPASWAIAASSVAMGLANVINIEKAYQQSQSAQYGFEGVIDEPTQFTVGEGGAAEYVSVTPMEGVNNAEGGGATIVIQGNVMTDDFVENELAEKIAEAVRRGTDFGIS